MPKNLVIVESPAKAKTIEKYLGSDFHVLASVGHIRKDTKVDTEHDFKVTYEVDPEKKTIINQLKKAAKAADKIWLATDEDREGEAISWHLLEVLDLPKNTSRITFHEITKPALEEAIKHPRTVNMDMVSSQQARQTLDMLVGFDLSGVVRRKVPGAISAGRVQSPALRLIVEREHEIEDFQKKSSFKITGTFDKDSQSFTATLEKHPVTSLDKAKEILHNIENHQFTVAKVDKTEGKKANPVPFTTATLQIEANSKLGFSSRTTMSAAQALYQAGLITYHRTDSLNLSEQAIGSISKYIEANYGKEYLQVRHFKTKNTSAQEAHEAIRPTHIENETAGRTDYEKKLYKLIRSRTLATQMSNALVAKTTVTLTPKNDPKLTFIAKGETVIFPGFLKVYGVSKDTILPDLSENDKVNYLEILAHEVFSKPPARYTEGSLVKKLEELGIGRPSTYATIMTAIQARGYVIKGTSEGHPQDVTELSLTAPSYQPETEKKPQNIEQLSDNLKQYTLSEKTGSDKGKLVPTPVGELVASFLVENFNQIVDYGFTANVEEKLDQIAEAKLERIKMLRDFYTPFAKLVEKSGAAERYNGATLLGTDPKTKKPVYAKIGKNGGFIQLGDNEKVSGEKPVFAPLPKNTTSKTVTFEQALKQTRSSSPAS